jgi:hypothetical protein
VTDVPTEAIRDAVAAELALVEARRRDRDALCKRVEVAKAELEEQRRRRRALEHVRPCDVCGWRSVADTIRHDSVAGKICTDCYVDAQHMTRDELRDALAWRLLNDDWDLSHAVYERGLARRVEFRFFAEAVARAVDEGTTRPEPGEPFAYVPVPAMRARLVASDPSVRPDEPERCPTHGEFMRRGVDGPFCRTCVHERLVALQTPRWTEPLPRPERGVAEHWRAAGPDDLPRVPGRELGGPLIEVQPTGALDRLKRKLARRGRARVRESVHRA